MLHLVAGLLRVEIRAGVEKPHNLIDGHVDLDEEADQGKPGRMGQVDVGRHLLQHLLDAQVYPVNAISFEKTICRRLLLCHFSQL